MRVLTCSSISFHSKLISSIHLLRLTKEDIINFVAWKEDPALSGVNKELRQVQNPFDQLGAVFRLEGCIADLVGMHARVWPKVAERYGYRVPYGDDIRKASLYTPAKAIREVLGWSDDVMEVDELVKAFRSEFNVAFNSWLEHDRTFAYPNDSTRHNHSGRRKTSAIGTSSIEGPSKDEIYELYDRCWKKISADNNKDPPTVDQLMKGISIRDWEVAIPDVFGWSEFNKAQIYDIVVEYDNILQPDLKALYQKYRSGLDDSDDQPKATLPPVERPTPSKEEKMTTYLIAWNKLAVEIGQKTPTKEQVMEGLRIRDWEVCIKDVFGWNEYSDEEIYNIVVDYDKILKEDFKTLYQNYGLDYGNTFSNKYPDLILQQGATEFL